MHPFTLSLRQRVALWHREKTKHFSLGSMWYLVVRGALVWQLMSALYKLAISGADEILVNATNVLHSMTVFCNAWKFPCDILSLLNSSYLRCWKSKSKNISTQSPDIELAPLFHSCARDRRLPYTLPHEPHNWKILY